MTKYSESPAKFNRNMSKKFKLSDKTSSAKNMEASNSELFKNATDMTGQATIGIVRNMRLKESPLLFQHKDIQYVESSRDKSAPRPSKQSPRDIKSVFLINKPDC